MVKDNQKLQSHWSNVSKIIERWLEERRELLAKYCDLTEVIDVSDNAVKHVEELQEFCELMVDYISVGHFEIFDQLHKEGQLFEDVSGLDKEPNLLEKIQITTEHVLDFNDKYLIFSKLSKVVQIVKSFVIPISFDLFITEDKFSYNGS